MTEITPIQQPRPKPPVRPLPKAKRKPKERASQGSRPTIILVALILVCVVLIFWRNRPAPAVLAAKIPNADAPTMIESSKQLKQMQAEGHKRTSTLIAERAAGLQNLPLQLQKGQPPVLKVQVKSFGRGCNMGDWDIIALDQQWLAQSKPNLVLSLEDLNQSGPPKIRQKTVTVDQLRQGLSTEFVLDGITDRTMMGLFLCSTHDNQPCHQQSQPSMGTLSSEQIEIRTGKKNQSDYPSDDKVFFFQFLVAWPDRVLLHDSNQSLESSQSRLQAALEKGGDTVSPSQLSDVMQRVRASGSLPGIVMSDFLQIQLPHRGDKCL